MPESTPPDRAPPKSVCRYRLTVGASVGAYPVITAILYGLGPVMESWAVWEKTLAIVPLMVPSMVFGIIPGVHRLGGRWLRRPARS